MTESSTTSFVRRNVAGAFVNRKTLQRIHIARGRKWRLSYIDQLLPPRFTNTHYLRPESKTPWRLLRTFCIRPCAVPDRSLLRSMYSIFDSVHRIRATHPSSARRLSELLIRAKPVRLVFRQASNWLLVFQSHMLWASHSTVWNGFDICYKVPTQGNVSQCWLILSARHTWSQVLLTFK